MLFFFLNSSVVEPISSAANEVNIKLQTCPKPRSFPNFNISDLSIVEIDLRKLHSTAFKKVSNLALGIGLGMTDAWEWDNYSKNSMTLFNVLLLICTFLSSSSYIKFKNYTINLFWTELFE